MTPAGLYIGACKGLVVCKGLVLDCTISQPQEQFPAVRYPNLCVTYVSN